MGVLGEQSYNGFFTNRRPGSILSATQDSPLPFDFMADLTSDVLIPIGTILRRLDVARNADVVIERGEIFVVNNAPSGGTGTLRIQEKATSPVKTADISVPDGLLFGQNNVIDMQIDTGGVEELFIAKQALNGMFGFILTLYVGVPMRVAQFITRDTPLPFDFMADLTNDTFIPIGTILRRLDIARNADVKITRGEISVVNVAPSGGTGTIRVQEKSSAPAKIADISVPDGLFFGQNNLINLTISTGGAEELFLVKRSLNGMFGFILTLYLEVPLK